MVPYNKKVRKIHNVIFITCIVFFGFLFILHSNAVYQTAENLDTLHLAVFLLGLFVIQQLCYAIFSLGFLIFGKLSGYKMAALRIAFMKWTKDKNGKIRFSTTNERGPSSQCKMYPPDMKNGKIPFLMYGHGIVIMALIFIAVFGVVLAFNFFTPVISSLLLAFIFILLTAVILEIFDGNGKRTRDIRKSPLAIKGLWLSCKLADPKLSDTRLSDLPDEWFDCTENADISIYWVSYYILACGERLLEKNEFEKAAEIFDRLLKPQSGLFLEQYMYALADRLYCELVTNNNPEIISKLYTDELKSFMRNLRTYTTLCRSFACTLLIENNPSGAAQIKAEFFEACKNVPSTADTQAETELLLLAENKYSNNA